ncbi:MAG: hypothetical protein JSR48_03230 [Verrucomicrobia bacterium]|nr:hypothetical protein [Verrucomicrobiota bacterium]
MNPAKPTTIDRYALIGDFAQSVRWFIQRMMLPLSVLLVGITGLLFISGSRGAAAFALISAGTLAVLWTWRSFGIGLPIVPLIAVQHLIVYGLPIVVNHEVMAAYPGDFVTRAGLEVLIFSVALAAGWRFCLGLFQPALPVSYALHGFRQQQGERIKRLGFTLIFIATAYSVAQGTPAFEAFYAALPAGSFSVLQSIASAASVCGFFLVSLFVSARALPPVLSVLFWVLLALDSLIMASGFLLSASTAMLSSVMIGLFWSRGRMPWRYLIVVGLVLGFLNLGKITMRERHWTEDGENTTPVSLAELPGRYSEWIAASYAAVSPAPVRNSIRDEQADDPKPQGLLDRINNLQNLLFVIDAMDTGHIKPMHGETYLLIPPLLVPRIFWPEKPRTHEGQVRLNVHFGRQDLESTLQTYIAWGLLPEADGNFGEKYGGIFLGLVLGLMCAWLENYTVHKLLLSLEGFVAFTILLGMANSFEMVASVLVTTIFQSVILLVVVGALFVERVQVRRPEGRAA